MRGVESPRDLPALRNRLATTDTHGLLDSTWVAGCDLYWVTADMTAVALDASHDMPAWDPQIERPTPRGLLLWRGLLPPVRGHYADTPVRPKGIIWAWNPDQQAMQVNVLFAVRDIIHVTGIPVDEPHTPPMDVGASFLIGGDGTPRRPRPAAFTDHTGLAALTGATWHLMQQPKIADTRPMRPGKRDVDAAERLHGSYPLVTTVDLRLLHHPHDPDAEPGASGRKLGVRHLVRGHWRQQYHPSDGSRRPRWIAPYLKGDEHLPLHLTETVQVWRR